MTCRHGHRRPGHWIKAPGDIWRCARCGMPVPERAERQVRRVAS